MIGHLVRRVEAEKREALLRLDDFCEQQEARVRALMDEIEARHIERNEDPFLREWDRLDVEVRR